MNKGNLWSKPCGANTFIPCNGKNLKTGMNHCDMYFQFGICFCTGCMVLMTLWSNY